ncbi:respiratory nitrate reductase subunit gamma [Nocardia macrotermitis]|uniref:Nitrate reductase-like protein NarX n=1 Tax=Nocardia macrotermitis TaxID=2585198 RepID=A0A7K0D1K7_9NOCA|nr:respiratory nitrate reductase subunit gamma [Nocardia macrotermitis]MQY19577.1 Nitrate reductase-like protein NarX [Nocardia macrotermitis]
MTTLIWLIVPYLAFASFVLGHWWRWRHDRFRSGVITNRTDVSRTGLWLFRAGVLVVVLPRIAQIVLTRTHFGSPLTIAQVVVASETIAAPIALTGAALLLIPAMVDGSARPVTVVDRITLPVLGAALLSGVLVIFDPKSTGSRDIAAHTLFTWFPSLFSTHPDPAAMADAPLLHRIRALTVVVAIALWPYTRLAGLFFCPIERTVRRLVTALTSVVRQAD